MTSFLVTTKGARMVTVSLVEAKTQLSKLVDKVEIGETIVITRHGKPVAHLTAANPPKQPIDFKALAAFRARMPKRRGSSAVAIRRMRDEERY
jgi:prevent-host-death family protein